MTMSLKMPKVRRTSTKKCKSTKGNAEADVVNGNSTTDVDAKTKMLEEMTLAGYDGSHFASSLEISVEDKIKRGKPPRRNRYLHYCNWVIAHCMVWGGLQLGALSPVVTLATYQLLGPRCAVLFLACAILSVLAPSRHSPAFCRFYLGSAACVGGSTVWVPDKILQLLQGRGYLVCFHPHGILPLGFSFNGALRVKAEAPEQFLPASFNFPKDCNGVQAPVLWRVPFLAPALRMWDACTPATKGNMKKLLAAKAAFGIIPGGSEDVAIHEHGKENVYINSRYGFIKYALQHGYSLILAYTFGENDQFYSLSCLRPLNLWLVKRFGFVLPIFWGKTFFPLLPRGGGLNTIYGRVIHLPTIHDPTFEDLVKWHALYVEELKSMFDEYKVKFGFGDRELHCF